MVRTVRASSSSMGSTKIHKVGRIFLEMRNGSVTSHHIVMVGTSIGFNNVRVVGLSDNYITAVTEIVALDRGGLGIGTDGLGGRSSSVGGILVDIPRIHHGGIVNGEIFFFDPFQKLHTVVLIRTVVNDCDTGELLLSVGADEVLDIRL